MKDRVVSYARIQLVAGVLLLVVLTLTVVLVFQVRGETARALKAEDKIVQDTIDRIALVAREERVASCEADDLERTVATRIIEQSGFPPPPEFAPRNCTAVGDSYAQRLREAGPLTEGD